MLLVVVMMLSLAACNNETPTETEPVINTVEPVPMEFRSATYLLGDWREDLDDGKRCYYISLLMYSEDYCADITVDNILYKVDGEYIPIHNAIEGVSVDLMDVADKSKTGICTYAMIKTPKLIDVKKIRVYIAGPSQYDAEAMSKDAYEAKYGSSDGWRALYTSISTKTPPHDAAAELQNTMDCGVIRLYDDTKSQFYYKALSEEPTIEGGRMTMIFELCKMTEGTSTDNLIQHLVDFAVCYVNTDGELKDIALDENLKMVCEIVDGNLVLGFETVDGSDISLFEGEIPDVITYPHETPYNFVIK